MKTVNLQNRTESGKNDLIKEIVFLEKLKNCNGVVKAFEYELKETEDSHWMYVLMEKGDMDLCQISVLAILCFIHAYNLFSF